MKDATPTSKHDIGIRQVSIHASVKDATLLYPVFPRKTSGFNPRVREGRDPRPQTQCAHPDPVSIHASVKDATGHKRQMKRINEVSIHASVKDATRADIVEAKAELFQSTRP